MADERTYIVTLDVTDPELDLRQIGAALTSDDDISNWWNHLPGTYIIKTRLSVNRITDRIHKLANDASFLVTEVNLAASNGWLPEKAWTWIRKRERERDKQTA